MKEKNIYAVMLGSIKSERKATTSRENGKLGGYWQQKRNYHKNPTGLNVTYVRTTERYRSVDNSQK